MSSEELKIDEKTLRVFKRKGYKINKKLSEGAFGQVYKASYEETGESRAVKVMDLQKVSEKFKSKFLPRELAALIEVKHKYIVRTYDIIKANKRIYIFMEFAGGGDLAGYIKKNGALEEPKACVWFTQICEALNYMHNEIYMAHRDIKIDNILLNEDQTDTKLSDFGFAKEGWDQQNNMVVLSETYCGTEPYYCPELVKRVKYDPFKADIWAMGVLLFAMVNNKFPFHFGKSKEMLKEMMDENHLKKRYAKKVSRHYKDLQQKLFDTNESTRSGINEVIKHKWIREKGECRH